MLKNGSFSFEIKCSGKAKLNSVVLGIDSLRENTKVKQVFKIKKEFPHPCFDRNTKENDIMLLQLKSKAKLNSFVKFLPLPESGDDVKVGTMCNVTGWGSTAAGNSQPSDMLQEVNITIIDRKKCSEYYKNNCQITDDMLCAGDKRGGKDACQVSVCQVHNILKQRTELRHW
uniref:Peptidase S1 domain-containing protein n=1 Tax=Callorhinchus milii TaxID=7868 RepID=A0A4W3K883_CALMI